MKYMPRKRFIWMRMLSSQLHEAFRLIICLQIPPCEDLFLELDSSQLRVTRVLQELDDVDEIMPTYLADLLGLKPGASFAAGVRVYRAAAPRPRTPKTGHPVVGGYERTDDDLPHEVVEQRVRRRLKRIKLNGS